MTARNPDDTADANDTEPEEIETPCMAMKTWREPTEATVEAKSIGPDTIQVVATEDFRTNVQLILSDEDARELAAELEEAAEEVVEE